MITSTLISHAIRRASWRFRLLHSSSSSRLIWMTHGQARSLLNGRRYGLGPHSLLYIPAGESFAFETSAQTTGYLIETSTEYEIGLPNMPVVMRFQEARQQADVTSLLDALHRETTTQSENYLSAATAYATLLGVWITRALSSTHPITTRPTASQRLMQHFLRALEQGYPEGYNVTHYAKHLGVTPSHLSRACKTHLGRTAAELISERALYAARQQLEAGTAPIKDITSNLGFGSPASFSRFVHNHTGHSPRELRAQQQRMSA
jgi:AraC family transcriptional activator of pobA